jgi:RecA/RadA recombinase
MNTRFPPASSAPGVITFGRYAFGARAGGNERGAATEVYRAVGNGKTVVVYRGVTSSSRGCGDVVR